MDKKKNKYKKNKNDNIKNNQNKEDKDDEEYDILESVGLKSIYYNDQVQRYFSKYYLNKGESNEQYIFIHSNGIIMCGIISCEIISCEIILYRSRRFSPSSHQWQHP